MTTKEELLEDMYRLVESFEQKATDSKARIDVMPRKTNTNRRMYTIESETYEKCSKELIKWLSEHDDSEST